MSMSADYERAFNEGGERAVLKVIKKHPSPLFWTTVSTGGHGKYVIPEVSIGNYIADFVLIWSCSTHFEVTLVECESVEDKVFTKQGNYAKGLNSGIRQVREWQAHIESHKLAVQQNLARIAKEKDVLSFYKGEVRNERGDRLSDMNTLVIFKYKIICGRASNMSEDARNRVPSLSNDIMFSTYDRLLSSAKEHDKNILERCRVDLSAHHEI